MDIRRLGCELRLDWEEQKTLASLATRLVSEYNSDGLELSEVEYNLLNELIMIGVPTNG